MSSQPCSSSWMLSRNASSEVCCLLAAERAWAATVPSARWEKSSTPIIQVSWPLRAAASASRTVVYSGFSVAMVLMTKPILMWFLR